MSSNDSSSKASLSYDRSFRVSVEPESEHKSAELRLALREAFLDRWGTFSQLSLESGSGWTGTPSTVCDLGQFRRNFGASQDFDLSSQNLMAPRTEPPFGNCSLSWQRDLLLSLSAFSFLPNFLYFFFDLEDRTVTLGAFSGKFRKRSGGERCCSSAF